MITYLSIFFLISLCTLIRKKHTGLLLKAITIFLIFFVGFRSEIGGDWDAYELIHQQIIRLDNVWIALLAIDPGYGLLNFIFDGEDGIYYVNFVCAIIMMLGVHVFSKQQPHPIQSLLVLLAYSIFVVGMGYTRQSAAIGLLLLAIVAFTSGSLKKAFLYVILASLFHFSAIFFLVIFFLAFDKKKIIQYTPVLLVLFVVMIYLAGDKISSKAEDYGSDSEMHSSGGLIRHLMNIIPAIIFFANRRYFKKVNPDYYKISLALSIASVILLLIAPFVSTMSDRIAQYVLPIQAIVLPVFIDKFVKRDRIKAIFLLNLYYFIFVAYWFYSSFYATNFWVPYKNFLFA